MAASDILSYLPNSYKTRDEQDYINFLWESYESNYDRGKYQFSFIAFHLLFMSYCYFQIWKIYNSNSQDFKKYLLGFEKLDTIFQDLEERNTRNRAQNQPIEQFYPFSFSEINERTIMTFFKLIDCDKSKIGKYKKIVDDRNEIAHANGKMIFVVDRDLDRKVGDIMLLTDEIFNHSKNTLTSFFVNYLRSSSDPETREYIEDIDQVREILVKSNYLSQKDIEHLLTFDITQLNADANYPAMQQLFETFTVEYAVV